jgi:hypothetical protein
MPASAGTGPKPRSRLRQAVPRLRWYWERCIADGQTDPVKAIQPRTGVALSLPPNIRWWLGWPRCRTARAGLRSSPPRRALILA